MGIFEFIIKVIRMNNLILPGIILSTALTLFAGCAPVVQNRDYINDGNSTKYKLSTYTTLDSTVNSFNCDTVITLERSGCLGKCPVFKLALLSNGSVYFQGRNQVKRTGIIDTLFNKNDLAGLVKEFYDSGFFRLGGKYDLTNCNGPTDLSSIVISIKTIDISKKVIFYIGCIDYRTEAKIITELADRIENISNVSSWIK